MVKRMIVMLAVTVAIVAALGFVKFQADPDRDRAGRGVPAATRSGHDHGRAARKQWPATLSAIGTVAAVQGVTVSADLPGMVERDRVRLRASGARRRRARELDTRQEQAQLAAREAQRELARLNFDRMQGLARTRTSISQAEYDRATAEHKQAEARVGEIRATIERKTIRAPFSGVLGIRQVNLGQYLDGRRSGRAAAVARSDLRELRRAAAGRGPDADRARRSHHGRRRAATASSRAASPRSTRSSTGDAQRPGAGDARQSGRQAAARHVRSGAGRCWAQHAT